MVRVIPMCGLCRRVLDDGFPAREATSWVDFPSYLTRQVVPPSQVQFSSDYCGECRLSFEILKSYGSS